MLHRRQLRIGASYRPHLYFSSMRRGPSRLTPPDQTEPGAGTKHRAPAVGATRRDAMLGRVPSQVIAAHAPLLGGDAMRDFAHERHEIAGPGLGAVQALGLAPDCGHNVELGHRLALTCSSGFSTQAIKYWVATLSRPSYVPHPFSGLSWIRATRSLTSLAIPSASASITSSARTSSLDSRSGVHIAT